MTGLQTRKFGQTPVVVAWVTNLATSPDLYIELLVQTLRLVENFLI